MKYDKKLLFLVNPNAGKANIKNHLAYITDLFVRNGYLVTLYTTQPEDDLAEITVELLGREDYDLLVCSGGDGTLNHVINGLLHLDSPPRLGYIPAGTTNDFAVSFALPKNPSRAADVIMNGVPTPFDAGKFMDDRYFAYVAAFGAFIDVSFDTPQDAKNTWGKAAYLMEGVKRLPSLHPHHIRLEYDGGVIEDEILLGIISNSPYVAGMPVGKINAACMNDGIMEVVLLKDPHNALELGPVISKFLAGELDKNRIYSLKSRKVHITSPDEILWTLDGECGGAFSEVKIENVPNALEIIAMPEGTRKK